MMWIKHRLTVYFCFVSQIGVVHKLRLQDRGVINCKSGKDAALPKFSDMLTLSLPRGADYAHPLALPHLKLGCDYAPARRGG